ncbi:hypothetical protein BDV11DRAFT_16519 [Aspergillus similis]
MERDVWIGTKSYVIQCGKNNVRNGKDTPIHPVGVDNHTKVKKVWILSNFESSIPNTVCRENRKESKSPPKSHHHTGTDQICRS